jgi:hypothetical protein
MSDRPTDAAIGKFKQARHEAIQAGIHAAMSRDALNRVHVANAAQLLAEGLTDLAVGLRAVYILLEQVQKGQQQLRT